MADRTRRARLRRWADVLHRWLGFTAGAILVVIGLTGSLLAFYVEIERAWYPHMQTPYSHARPASYEAVYQRLAALPIDPPGGSWRIEIPPDGGVITSRYSAPGARTRMVTLDPVTLDVLRDAYWNRTFFTFIYDIHEYLQIGSRARPWIGYVSLVMVLVLFTGAASWLLPRGRTGAKFSFRWNGTTTSRRTYDIHKVGGAYTLLFMALVVGTGALISMPNQFHGVLNLFSPLTPSDPAVRSTPSAGSTRLPVDVVLAMGPARFPDSTVVWVRVPAAPTQTYDLQIRQKGAPMNRFPRTHLFIDQYSRAVLAVYDPQQEGWGDTVLNWLVPIHDGKAFGLIGRIVVFVLGLMPLVLFVTGFMRWNQKRRARNRARSRPRWLGVAAKVSMLAVVITLAPRTTAAFGHHSYAATYFEDRTETIQGEVVQFLFRNPHSFLYVEVKRPTGAPVRYAIEWAAGLQLNRHGVTQQSFRPGDHIIVIGNPSRTPADHRLRLTGIIRSSDGWKWGGPFD